MTCKLLYLPLLKFKSMVRDHIRLGNGTAGVIEGVFTTLSERTAQR